MTKTINFVKKEIEVLIVEDETVLAFGMEASLEDLGYSISGIESSAQNAISHVENNLPDIVIMDINLKGPESGIKAANEIWKKFNIPIIFLTSYSDEQTFKEAMSSEPYAYILKPCRDRELDLAIKTALHKHKYFFKNKNCLDEEYLVKLVGGYEYNKAKRVLYKDKEAIKLTGNEIKFFDILSHKKGETVSFERILSYIYRDDYSEIGKLRTLVYRLRMKLEVDLFDNAYEFGYRLKIV